MVDRLEIIRGIRDSKAHIFKEVLCEEVMCLSTIIILVSSFTTFSTGHCWRQNTELGSQCGKSCLNVPIIELFSTSTLPLLHSGQFWLYSRKQGGKKKKGSLYLIVQIVYSYQFALQVAYLKRSMEEIALVFWVILILARSIKY